MENRKHIRTRRCISLMLSMEERVFLEVEGNRLDLKWVCADGEIRDQFTIVKPAAKAHVPK
ncbi:hypothetical protein [Pedobacter sp. NJ-S-72]